MLAVVSLITIQFEQINCTVSFCSQATGSKIFKYVRVRNCVPMDVVSTVKGNISSELYDFVLLVDGPDSREPEWVLNCCAALHYNDISTRTNLIGLLADDLCMTDEQTGLAVSGAQRAWIRQCIEQANREVVGAIAKKGDDAPPQQSEASSNSCNSADNAIVDPTAAPKPH